MINALFTIRQDPTTIGALVQRANRILIKFTENADNGTTLIHLAQKHITDKTIGDRPAEDQKLLQTLESLRGDKKISEAQAEAFLCTPADTLELQSFQAVVLLAALEHHKRFGKPERPLRAMMVFRLLYEDRTKSQKRLRAIEVDKYLAVAWHSVEEIVSRIDLIFEELSDDSLSYAHQRLMPVRRILRDLIAESLENLRTSSSSSGEAVIDAYKLAAEHEKPTGSLRTGDTNQAIESYGDFGSYPDVASAAEPDQLHGDDVAETEDTPAYIELSAQPILSDTTQDPSERRADNQTSGVFLATQFERSAPASLRRSHVLSAVHAKTVAGSIERREKRLICLTNRLSKYETEILISELKSRMQQCDASYMLYLALATGRKPAKLLQARPVAVYRDFQEVGSGYFLGTQEIYWLYRQALPAHRLPKSHRSLLDQQQTPVVLPVPCSAEVMRHFPETDSQELELQAEALLKKINKANSTNLSIGKIADHLANFLHHQGVDDVLIALITGNPDIQEAGLYYTQYDSVSIYKAYQRYREKELRAETQDPIESKVALGGSQLVVTENAVTGIFDHLQKNVQALQGQGWDKVHYGYVMYVLHLLNFTTGHRPVRDPFDDIEHIDLISKKIFISDKESRLTTSSARTLVLPDIAVTQIGLYIEHLEKLHVQMQSLSPEFAQQVSSVLNGKSPLFFLIDRGSAIDDIRMAQLSPKSVVHFWSGVLDLPPNWHRHFLRTYLSQQKMVSGESIDTWMGHAKPGQEGLTRYSGMSIKSLETIALKIEQLCIKLKIIPLTSQGRSDG
ncbi:MAG TPA: hypothetical protein ENH72_09770 [Pseudomonas sabulinigri]|uniref:Uncharacterized protein n=1 Tax=marine sediment metagenome TaxID=412755 RepID=A0A0F9RD39_9ZZZZ|nr:hypothetical protein [Halopseudomonas sabulinigri]HEC52610.1 hypothetical protein [Halopseudomonas sabulinigri]